MSSLRDGYIVLQYLYFVRNDRIVAYENIIWVVQDKFFAAQ